MKRSKTEIGRGDAASRTKTDNFKQEQERLFERVSHTREFVLDAEAGATLGKIVCDQVINVEVALSSDNPVEFGAKVKQWFTQQRRNNNNNNNNVGDDTDAELWSLLGRHAGRFFGAVGGLSHAMGCGAGEEVERKQRQQQKRSDHNQIEGEKRVQQETAQEQEQGQLSGATMKQIDRLDQQLKTVGSYALWKMLINPNSVARTVEHTFHMAFLVKEHRAQIQPSEHEGLTVKCSQPPMNADDSMERVQAVVRIDADMIRRMTAYYNIKKPFIEDNAAPPVARRTGIPSSSPMTEAPGSAQRAFESPAVAPTQLLDSETPGGESVTTPLTGKRRKK